MEIIKKIEHILKSILKELNLFYYNFKEEWKDETYIKVRKDKDVWK